jgi:hypothetical protein
VVNHHDLFGWVAAIVSFVAYPIYIVEFVGGPTKNHWATRWIWRVFRLKGATDPHQVTWLLWSVLSFTIYFSSTQQGSTSTTSVPLFYCVGSTITAILLIKYGEHSWKRLDVVCGILAVVSLALMLTVPAWALALAITTDAIAAIPTVIGVARNPRSESLVGWSFFMTGALINLGAIKNLTFADAGYAFYLVLVIGYIFLWTTLGRLRKRRAT